MIAMSRRPRHATRSLWMGCSLALLVMLCVSGADLRSATAGDAPAAWVSSTSGLHAQGISSLRMHPKHPDRLYAHVHGMGAARSTDGGKTWKAMMNGIRPTPDPRSPIRLSLDLTKLRRLYMVVEGQVYRSEDGGDEWKNITTGALASYSRDRRSTAYLGYEIRVNRGKGIHLVLGTYGTDRHHGGVFESRDGGKTWEQIGGSNLGRSEMGDEGHDTFLVRLDPKTDKNMLAAGRTHVWRSSDRGRTWSRDDPGGPGHHDIRAITDPAEIKKLFLADARGIWESRGVGKKWGKKPLIEGDVTSLVGGHKRLYAIFADEGLKISQGSRHKKWLAVGADKDGYASAEPHEVMPHPKDKRTLYITSAVTGLHLSTDGGATIAPVAGSNIPAVVPGMADAVVHPLGDHIALSVTEHGVVFRSTDNGQSWVRAGRLGQRPHRLMAGKTVGEWFATGRRLMRSVNGGTTWAPFYTPVDAENRVIDLQFATIDGKSTLLGLLERTGEIVKTADAGQTWTQTNPPEIASTTWARSMAVNPANAKHMIMATRSLRLVWSDQDTDGGVFETLDGGKTWRDVSRNLRPLKGDSADDRRKKSGWNFGRVVLMDPVANLMLYGADGGGLYARSLPDAKGKFADNDWWPVTPKQMPGTRYGAVAYATHSGVGDAPATSQVTIQLSRPEADVTPMVSISGAGLRALYNYACPGRRKQLEKEGGEKIAAPAGWADAPGPTHAIVSLHAIPGTTQGLIGTDMEHRKGVVFYASGLKAKGSGGAGKPEGADEEAEAVTKLDPPEGMWGFSASADHDINVWQLRSKKRAPALRGHGAEVYSVVMAGDETVVASGGADRKVRFWDGSQLTPVGEIDTPGGVTALIFDDDSEFLYAACDSWQITQIKMEGKKEVGVLEGSAGAVLCLARTEDTARLYSGGKDGKVRTWDTIQRKELSSVDFGAEVYSIAVGAEGGRIYVGGKAGALKVYDAAGAEVGSWALPDGQTTITTMRLGVEGKLLYVGGEGGVNVLDANTLKLVRKHTGPEKAVLCIDISADGVWLFGGDEDNGLWLWQFDISAAVWQNAGAHAGAVFSVALSPDETEVGNSELPVKPDGDGDGESKPDGSDKPDGDSEKKPAGGDAKKPDDGAAKPDDK